MGKAARLKRQRRLSSPTEALFHGGVPGLEVGARLMSATDLGAVFTYIDQAAVYDPGFVYVTTDPDVARAYAARYLAPDGRGRPGDLYRVQAVSRVGLDSDYSRHGEFQGVFLRCREALVIDVVAQGIEHSPQELVQLESRYLVWGRADRPIYDSSGYIIPSEQMRDHGITAQWTKMLRPWLEPTDLDGRGQLTPVLSQSRNPWADLLDLVPSLDGEHRIDQDPVGQFVCVACGTTFTDRARAARHQLGERQVTMLTQVHRRPIPFDRVAAEAANRRPARWAWL